MHKLANIIFRQLFYYCYIRNSVCAIIVAGHSLCERSSFWHFGLLHTALGAIFIYYHYFRHSSHFPSEISQNFEIYYVWLCVLCTLCAELVRRVSVLRSFYCFLCDIAIAVPIYRRHFCSALSHKYFLLAGRRFSVSFGLFLVLFSFLFSFFFVTVIFLLRCCRTAPVSAYPIE